MSKKKNSAGGIGNDVNIKLNTVEWNVWGEKKDNTYKQNNKDKKTTIKSFYY